MKNECGNHKFKMPCHLNDADKGRAAFLSKRMIGLPFDNRPCKRGKDFVFEIAEQEEESHRVQSRPHPKRLIGIFGQPFNKFGR